jgi:hypothetical protein
MTSRAAVGSAALFFGEGSNKRLQRFGYGTFEETGAYYSEHKSKDVTVHRVAKSDALQTT